MFAQSERPQKFSEVVGEVENSRILMTIAKNPANTPNSLILSGTFGSGKTSSARLLFKALNCDMVRAGKASDICGVCPQCSAQVLQSRLYNEYDSSELDNKKSIDEIIGTFSYGTGGRWRVVVFDEAQLLPKSSQSALLKVLEEKRSLCKFVLCTTDPDDLMPTIRSRSLELNYTTKPTPVVEEAILKCAEKHQIDLDPASCSLIAQRSHGYMRDAYMLLDRFVLSGKDVFLRDTQNFQRSLSNFIIYTVADTKPDKTILDTCLERLLSLPVATFRDEYQRFFLDLLRLSVLSGAEASPMIVYLGKTLRANCPMLKIPMLVRYFTQNWVIQGFTDDVSIQTTLLLLYTGFRDLRK